MWPTFAVLTIAEGVLLHELPPTGFRIPDVVIGSILALFANIFLVGAVAPWIARRLVARDRAGGGERFPPQGYLDRTATALLAGGALGGLAAGLANIPRSTARTAAPKEAGRPAGAHVKPPPANEDKQR